MAIYSITALLIFLYFRGIYAFSDKYEITTFISEKRRIPNNEREQFVRNQKYNPVLPMKFSLFDNKGKNLSDEFIIIDSANNIYIERDKIINKRVDDINFVILYKCDINNNTNNDTNKTSCEVANKDRANFFQFVIRYQGFDFEPQSEIPVNQLPKNVFNAMAFVFNSEIKLRQIIEWTITRYEDNKGLFQLFDYFREKEPENIRENNILIGGRFEDFETLIISSNTQYIGMNNTKLLLSFQSLNLNHTNTVFYHDYKRKKKSILDCYANIFSLWIYLYKVFTFLFLQLYSKTFDKYKIIENILSKQKESLIKSKRPIYQGDKINETLEGDEILENDFEKENHDKLLSNDKYDEENKKIDDINNENNLIEKEVEQERILPKPRFLDLIYNTFEENCYCCCHCKRQELICACNKIIYQYYSIENILYNQIMIENLFEDYKWNNPELKNIFNNKSLYEIKNNLSKNYD